MTDVPYTVFVDEKPPPARYLTKVGQTHILAREQGVSGGIELNLGEVITNLLGKTVDVDLNLSVSGSSTRVAFMVAHRGPGQRSYAGNPVVNLPVTQARMYGRRGTVKAAAKFGVKAGVDLSGLGMEVPTPTVSSGKLDLETNVLKLKLAAEMGLSIEGSTDMLFAEGLLPKFVVRSEGAEYSRDWEPESHKKQVKLAAIAFYNDQLKTQDQTKLKYVTGSGTRFGKPYESHESAKTIVEELKAGLKARKKQGDAHLDVYTTLVRYYEQMLRSCGDIAQDLANVPSPAGDTPELTEVTKDTVLLNTAQKSDTFKPTPRQFATREMCSLSIASNDWSAKASGALTLGLKFLGGAIDTSAKRVAIRYEIPLCPDPPDKCVEQPKRSIFTQQTTIFYSTHTWNAEIVKQQKAGKDNHVNRMQYLSSSVYWDLPHLSTAVGTYKNKAQPGSGLSRGQSCLVDNLYWHRYFWVGEGSKALEVLSADIKTKESFLVTYEYDVDLATESLDSAREEGQEALLAAATTEYNSKVDELNKAKSEIEELKSDKHKEELSSRLEAAKDYFAALRAALGVEESALRAFLEDPAVAVQLEEAYYHAAAVYPNVEKVWPESLTGSTWGVVQQKFQELLNTATARLNNLIGNTAEPEPDAALLVEAAFAVPDGWEFDQAVQTFASLKEDLLLRPVVPNDITAGMEKAAGLKLQSIRLRRRDLSIIKDSKSVGFPLGKVAKKLPIDITLELTDIRSSEAIVDLATVYFTTAGSKLDPAKVSPRPPGEWAEVPPVTLFFR